jgi:FecR-like protein
MTGKIQSVAIQSVIVALAIAAVVAIAGVAPSLAQQVGTATAVNPSSEGTPPGGSTTTLTVGARVLHKEHIHTSPTGSVQLLFLDKSTLNIAPNTNLVIDEFVYDPASSSGHMLTKLTQGTLQYIGGQLSHQGAVTITTPAATIGIRGGTATVDHGANGTQVVNQYGTITISNGGGTIVVTRPGFVVSITNWNTPPGQPAQVTADLVIHYIEYLSSKFGQNGGVSGLNGLPTIGFACGALGLPACPQAPWLPTNTGENDATQIIVQGTQLGSEPTPPAPPPVTAGSNVRGN